MLKRVAIVFSGGPAPAANAVISSAASALMRSGAEVIGIQHGYTALQDYDPDSRPMVEGADYRVIQPAELRGQRNSRGVMLGTARANPGRQIDRPEHFEDPTRTAAIDRVYRGLLSLGVEALVSIGGDGTLMTANTLHRYQDHLEPGAKRIRIIHVPKTIDNDYSGIDFTFGFFTAVDFMSKELLNLRADAIATRSYFVVEVMGRMAGWLGYGVAIAGEAHMMVGVEDVVDELVDERAGPRDGLVDVHLDLDALCDRIIKLIETRSAAGKHYGVVVLAEGLVELLPPDTVAHLPRDQHGMISLGKLNIGKLVAERAQARFREHTGAHKKLTGVQLGYEARCAMPHAFDVVLGCQLGIGAALALTERNADACMVSISGQMKHRLIPFADLVDPNTLKTTTRFIEPGSDFHSLAHRLGTRLPQ